MGAMLLAAGPVAQAAPLNLVLANNPDILVQGMTVSYDAGTRALTATGFAVNIDAPPVEAIASGEFSLMAVVSNAGVLLGGEVQITGTIANLGYNSGTLLTGDLTRLGFDPLGGDPLEFVFDITGGDAAASFLAVRPFGGILMSFTGFTDWGSSWSSGVNTAVADVAPVPLPAAAWLFGSALLGLVGVARRRRSVA
jgi:hypothetical protein